MTLATPALPETLPAIAARAARLWPDKAALIDGGRTWTFAGLYNQVRRAAAAYLAWGIHKGDVVALWAPNRIEWIVAALSAQAAGAILTPLNTRLKGREAADILHRSRARLLVTVGHFLGVDYPALLAGETLPALQGIVTLDGNGPGGWEAFLERGPGPDDPAVDEAMARVTGQDPSDILFTSGTTGAPKGVVSGHLQTIRLFQAWSDAVDLRVDDRMLIINPFFHTFGYKAGWLAALMMGATSLPLAQFDMVEVARLIREEGVSFLPGPPTIFQSLLAEQHRLGTDRTSLRVAVTGAATVPPILVARMQTELGFQRVVTGYGMTECGAIAMCRAGDSVDRIATTCGRALDGLEVVCADDQGRPLSPGETGEILVRGFGVMQGYLDDPAATAEAIDTKGWLHTGDIGTLDADGYLRITDRKKDMYITGGFNCYPAEIEKLLCAHPKVEMAAVIGVPDERLGEVGRAFLVLRPGEQAEADEIVAWSKANMANYKVPRSVVFLTSLPKNAAGKVMRKDLKPPAS
ncbi:acyl-CoA synthetase (AMP-forming)/AMP-acid ligase II [Nitrospirillum amazonense]|uniref:Acyl-CoA synthetase (AMP-forming)/AMP-acid ligase II n=1 Tax=Nitrospirillum amazonense TaxID=28077 RepID=A0A560F9T8_9PROT|nr:FadD3 family acyl-CoA ligase [Nitrospirillum amazonense]TWB18379.1 acyl-CoA synthetase (AMP-forming)/AMP-acid ligase II [Nitrospirillum amazonense]TWB66100.1 acyl-CoA synthetase (AMP-forming)/AMP-acid ligase II [Nitrospirillum amazonense]